MDAPDPEQPRRDVPFTWISSQRGRSARAGRRRWADLRGPLLAAAMLGLLQAGLVGLALEAFSALDVRAIGVVPVVAMRRRGAHSDASRGGAGARRRLASIAWASKVCD